MTGHAPAVAVTGMGCVCATGLHTAQCLDGIFNSKRSPSGPRRFQSSHPLVYPVFAIPDAFFAHNSSQDETRTLTVRYALRAAAEALNQAGLSEQSRQELRIGVCIGTTVGATLNNEDFYRAYLAGEQPDMGPVRRYLNNNPATAIARAFGLTGPCQTVVNSCSSGTDAIGIAAGWIRGGACDAVLAGGADELCRMTYNGFASLKIMDSEPCRPFDRARQGLNLGEGAGILVLESDALQNRDTRPLGHVLGYGSASDAHHLTAPHPKGDGLRRAVTEALRLSCRSASDVAFVNAHGTGTRDNDKVESSVLGDLLPEAPFFSTKGATGHTLGAAGGIEAVFTLACLNLGRIPASIGFSEADPEMAAVPPTRQQNIAKNIALSQSLAFGGSNGVLVFEGGLR